MTDESPRDEPPPIRAVSRAEQEAAAERMEEVDAKIDREAELELKALDFEDDFAEKEIAAQERYAAKIAAIKKIEARLLKSEAATEGFRVGNLLFTSWTVAKLEYHGLSVNDAVEVVLKGIHGRSGTSGSTSIWGKTTGGKVTLIYGPTIDPKERALADFKVETAFSPE